MGGHANDNDLPVALVTCLSTRNNLYVVGDDTPVNGIGKSRCVESSNYFFAQSRSALAIFSNPDVDLTAAGIGHRDDFLD
jgi:hypothetical protein